MSKWLLKSFEELSTEELYKIIQLRIEVFVVEQNCPFQDCDDIDQKAYHLMKWDDKKLVAYSRILPAGLTYNDASIGRVVTSSSVRQTKTGRELMQVSLDKLFALFGKTPVTIGAQLYLKKFYESFDFIKISDIYLEDDIEHIKMRYNPDRLQ